MSSFTCSEPIGVTVSDCGGAGGWIAFVVPTAAPCATFWIFGSTYRRKNTPNFVAAPPWFSNSVNSALP